MCGDSFYEACKESYYLIKRNAKRFRLISSLGSQFNTLGKLFLCLTTSFICYVLMIKMQRLSLEVTETLVPVGVIFLLFLIKKKLFLLVSYTTGSFFMNLYGQSADTLLLISFMDVILFSMEI